MIRARASRRDARRHAFVAFWKINFPLLIPGLTAGVTIVFSLAMSSYVTPALMGGRDAGMLTTLIDQQLW